MDLRLTTKAFAALYQERGRILEKPRCTVYKVPLTTPTKNTCAGSLFLPAVKLKRPVCISFLRDCNGVWLLNYGTIQAKESVKELHVVNSLNV